MKLKKGDTVYLTSGKDKDKKGTIEKVFPKEDKVQIAGLNIFKKHLKKRSDGGQGGIIQFSRPLSTAKVSLLCPKCKKITRVGFNKTKDEKIRICKKCEQPI